MSCKRRSGLAAPPLIDSIVGTCQDPPGVNGGCMMDNLLNDCICRHLDEAHDYAGCLVHGCDCKCSDGSSPATIAQLIAGIKLGSVVRRQKRMAVSLVRRLESAEELGRRERDRGEKVAVGSIQVRGDSRLGGNAAAALGASGEEDEDAP